MKGKRFYSVIFTAVFICGLMCAKDTDSKGSFNFGICGEFSFNGLEGTVNGMSTDFDMVHGTRFGFFAGLDSPKVFGLRAEVLWHHNNGCSWINGGNKNKVSFKTIAVPLLVKAAFCGWEGTGGKLSVLAGPVFNFGLGNVDFSNGGFSGTTNFELKKFVPGMEVGLEFVLPGKTGLSFGARSGMDFDDFITADNSGLRRFYITTGMSFNIASLF